MSSNERSQPLRLGTRGSLLARTQSRLVADAVEAAHPGVRVELVPIKTTGDRITDQPLHAFGGKGLFTKELEQALLDGDVDFAVHSFKDVPVTMPLVDQSNLIIAAVPAREDVRDVLIAGQSMRLEALPARARVGTGSLRRRCQALHARPDLVVEPIRGNIDTRLRKLREGAYDAILLAMAGVRRAGLFDPATMSPVDARDMLPAPGQGALALQCRRDDGRTREVLAALNDPPTADCVAAERELVWLLGGDCHSPIAALAESLPPEGPGVKRMRLTAAVGARDGDPPVLRAVADVPIGETPDPAPLARMVFEDLRAQGVEALLRADGGSGLT